MSIFFDGHWRTTSFHYYYLLLIDHESYSLYENMTPKITLKRTATLLTPLKSITPDNQTDTFLLITLKFNYLQLLFKISSESH